MLLAAVKARSVQLDEERAAAVEEAAHCRVLLDDVGTFAHVGTWRMEMDSQKVTWSGEVLRIHEVDVHEEFSLKDALDFYPEPDRQHVADLVSKALEQQQQYQFEADLLTARGNLKRVRSFGRFDFSGSNGPALAGILHDITDDYNRIQELEVRTDKAGKDG